MRKILEAIIVIIFLFAIVGCELFDTSIDVEYKITGSASQVDITYENEDEGTSQESNVSVPWTYSFKGQPGQFVYVSAQNQGQSGSVTATINTDGEKFKSSTSSGAYVIATASGSL